MSLGKLDVVRVAAPESSFLLGIGSSANILQILPWKWKITKEKWITFKRKLHVRRDKLCLVKSYIYPY